jgi:dolichol-phosphate mannosyltransferase
MNKKTISIVITAYNEEDNVIELHRQLNEVILEIPEYNFELIFIENGSTDKTLENLKVLSEKDSKLKIIKLSRNFGFDGGMTAGLDNVTADAAIVMTANLQDNPYVIPEFIEKWEEGFDMVYGVVKSRPGKSIIRKFNSKIYYKILKRATNNLIPKDVSDYRLIDKKVINALTQLRESNRFFRGFFSWVGFSTIGVEFERQKRFSGESKAKTFKVLGFAIRGLFAFSNLPLRISTFLTILFSVMSFLILTVQIYRWITFGVPFDGFGTIIGIFLLFSSLLFGILSVLGQYIGLIFEETKSRPLYIIDEVY